jgi:plastocyanin
VTFPLLMICALAAAPDDAVIEGTVRFEVKGLTGTQVAKGAQAVVYLEKLDGAAAKPTEGAALRQTEKRFDPRLLVVTAGSKVDFPNDDLVFHNVFSLSKGNEFDLGLYRQGSSKTVKFSNPGVVDVFCNIHPEMIATVLVVQNDRYAVVDPDGHYSLSVPPGKHTLAVYWSAGVLERKEIEVEAGGKTTVDLTLTDSGRARHLNKYGQQYGRYK